MQIRTQKFISFQGPMLAPNPMPKRGSLCLHSVALLPRGRGWLLLFKLTSPACTSFESHRPLPLDKFLDLLLLASFYPWPSVLSTVAELPLPSCSLAELRGHRSEMGDLNGNQPSSPAWHLSVKSVKYSINTYVRYLSYALLVIAELPNDELTGNHTLSLPPLCL